VCQAAQEAVRAGVTIFAAAGNEPGKTYCPAKAGIVAPNSGIISVTAYNYETHKMEPYSGTGNIAGPVGDYRLVPVE